MPISKTNSKKSPKPAKPATVKKISSLKSTKVKSASAKSAGLAPSRHAKTVRSKSKIIGSATTAQATVDVSAKHMTEATAINHSNNGEVRLTPKIRISRVNALSDNGQTRHSGQSERHGFVVDLKARRPVNQPQALAEEFEEAESEVGEDGDDFTLLPDDELLNYDDLNLPAQTKETTELNDDLPELPSVKSRVKSNSAELADIEEDLFDPSPARSESKPEKIHIPKLYQRIAVVFGILVLLLGAGLLYFIIVRVTIAVTLNESDLANKISIPLYDRAPGFILPEGSLAGLVKRVEVEQSKLYQVSGNEIIGEEVVGQITLYNKYTKNQPLVASTRLLSASGKLYRLKNAVTVPANSSVTADIYADQAKPEMVVGAESFTVPGLWEGLQDKIYGETKADSIKYQQKLRRIITQADIDLALADLRQVILDKVKADADNSYNDYDQKMFKLDEASLSFKVTGAIGEEKEQLPVSMKAVVELVAFSSMRANELVAKSVQSQLTPNQEFVELQDDAFSYELIKYDYPLAMAEIAVAFKAKLKTSDKADIVDKSKLVGLTEAQVRQYLSSLGTIKSFTIQFYPNFIRQVPRLEDRIEIKLVP